MKLPKGWSEVTIKTFCEYYTLSTSKIKDTIDYNVRVLSIFSGLPIEKIEMMTGKQLLCEIKKLAFLSELPTQKIPYVFKCGKNTYKSILVVTDMKAGQLMTFNDILKNTKQEDYIYQMPILLSAMCQKRQYGIFIDDGKISINRWVWKNDSADEFRNHMTMEQAYPLYVFFAM
jgi:hypothetical protein